MNFFNKIRAKKESKEYFLSPKGACLKIYCEKILTGKLSPSSYIEAYEDEIKNIQKIIQSQGEEKTREEVASVLFNILNSMKEN